MNDLSKGYVLIVETNENLAEAMRVDCEARGFKSLQAKRLRDATVMMQKQRFSCVVFNLNMDGESVHDYILRMRKSLQSLNQDTPVIVVGEKFEKSDFEKLGRSINAAVLAPFKEGALGENVSKVGLIN